MASENYTLVNNTEKAQGGPYTREDPSDGRKKSCLDFALVTNKLLPFIKELLIDSERKYAMNRVTYEKGLLTLKPSDHYTMFLVFHNLPLGIEKKEKDVRWNKPGGWKKYEEVTNDRAKDIHKIVENKSKSVDEMMEGVEKIFDKIKFQSFGKTKIRKSKTKSKADTIEENRSGEAYAKNLMKKQSDILANEIADIKDMKQGRTSKVFKLRERIIGTKKQGQEACAVKDPKTKELIVATEETKRVSLEYCKEF